MKVLVTGAAGRVGANVVKRLCDAGADVRALVLPGDAHVGKLSGFAGLEIVEGDLADQRAVDRACDGVTHVIHLAAQMVRGDTPVDRFYDVNTLSTLRLLEAVRDATPRVERFVLASTDATFRPGDAPPVPLTESAPQRPVNHYGLSKLLGETILRNRAIEYGIPHVIVRFATVVSPEEAPELFRLGFLRGWVATQAASGKESSVWPLLADRDLTAVIDAAAGEAPPETATAFVGPEGPWRLSVMDVRDAADGVYRALTAPGAVGRSFNLAAAEPVSWDDAAAAIAEIFGVGRLTVDMPMTWRLEISIDAAREHLGYEPVYSYRDMLHSAEDAGVIRADEGDDGVYAKLTGRGA